MLKLASLVFVLFASAPTTPKVLFEIDTTDLAAGPEKNVVYADGSWRLDRSGGGTATGQLSAADLATIERAAAAPWTTTPRTGITCHMEHAPTTYLANGKTVYVDSGCSSPVLDEASSRALGEIRKVLAANEK